MPRHARDRHLAGREGLDRQCSLHQVIGVEADRTAEGGIACRERNRHGEPERSEIAVQSGAQPLDDPTSAQLADQLAKSPMWFKQESGTGSVSLDLENVPSGRSAVAASAGGPGDLTFTLTWQVEQVNLLAIIAFLTAAFFAFWPCTLPDALAAAAPA